MFFRSISRFHHDVTIYYHLTRQTLSRSFTETVHINKYKEHRILREIQHHHQISDAVSEMSHFQKFENQDREQIMQIIRRDGPIEGDTVYIDAIRACNRMANYQTALRIFDVMQLSDVIQSVDACNALIQCLCDCDRTELSYKYFKSFADQQINIKTCTILIVGCKQRVSLIDIAENVWRRMVFDLGLIPDVHICHGLLSVYIRNRERMKVDMLWRHLRFEGMVNSAICAEMMSMEGQNQSHLQAIQEVNS